LFPGAPRKKCNNKLYFIKKLELVNEDLLRILNKLERSCFATIEEAAPSVEEYG